MIMDYKEERYFASSKRIQVWCSKCKDYQGHYILQGHYLCGKCHDLMGFPHGGLMEPARWCNSEECPDIDNMFLVWVPYKWDGHLYNEGNRIPDDYITLLKMREENKKRGLGNFRA